MDGVSLNELAYVTQNFRKCVKYKNLLKVEEFKKHEDLNLVAKSTIAGIENGTVWSNGITETRVKGKKAWSVSSPKAILLHNLLVKNLGRNYNTKCNDRQFTVQLLLSHLRDSYNYSIHRLDIKSFYESFDRREIFSKLKNDSKLSKKSLNVISSFFGELANLDVQGLPRGMGISAAISELMMEAFDEAMSSCKGVLYYSRFVDDIIIITNPNVTKANIATFIDSSRLPSKLEFHNKGTKVFYSLVKKADKAKNAGTTVDFDFLGYFFHLESFNEKLGDTVELNRRKVSVSIAPQKIENLKKRIISSFAACLSSSKSSQDNLDLLNNRIKFLTKNYLLENSTESPSVYSGVYYNYKLITKLEQLNDLDKFYRNILFGNKSKLNKRIRKSIPYNVRLGLSKYSFLEGFEQRLFCRFSYKDFKEIKRVWI